MGTKLTAAGATLLARAIAGETLIFTRGGLGDAMINDDVVIPTEDEQAAFNNLIHERLNLPIVNPVEVLQSGRAKIECLVSNADVAEGFRVREYGLFAKIGNETEQLYAYCYAGEDGDYMPANSSAVAKAYVLELIVILSNAANVTAIISPNAEVTRADFDAHINSTDPHTSWTTFNNRMTFDGGAKFTGNLNADSITTSFNHSTVQALAASIDAENSNVDFYASNITLGSASIHGDVAFYDEVSLNNRLYADSIQSYFNDARIFMKDATIRTGDSIDNRLNIDGRTRFTDSTTFEGNLNADSITTSFNHSTVRALAASIDAQNSNVDLFASNITLGSASIHGDPVFIDKPDFRNDFFADSINAHFRYSNLRLRNASIGGSPYFPDGLVLGTASSTQDGAIWFVP